MCPRFKSDSSLVGSFGAYDYLLCTSQSQENEKYDLASINIWTYTSSEAYFYAIDFEDNYGFWDDWTISTALILFEGTDHEVTVELTPYNLQMGDDFHEIKIKVDPDQPFPSLEYLGIYLEDVKDDVECFTSPTAVIGNVSGVSPGILIEYFDGQRVDDAVELYWRGTPGVDAAGVKIFRAANGDPQEVIHNGILPYWKSGNDTLRYVDYAVNPGDELEYRIAVEFCNSVTVFAEQTVCLSGQPSEILGVPSTFALEQNYPNPFNSGTRISFAVDDANVDRVTLEIFNILGQHITTIFKEENPAPDNYSVNWNGRDFKGRPVASGVYFYRLKTSANQISKRMVLIR